MNFQIPSKKQIEKTITVKVYFFFIRLNFTLNLFILFHFLNNVNINKLVKNL